MRIGLSTFVAVLLLSVPASPVQAQSPASYGIKAGFTSSSVSTNMFADEIERREGLSAVAFAEWFDMSYFSLLTELGYTQRGYSRTVEVRNPQGERLGTEERSTRFDYLTVAALAKLQYPGSALKPYAVAGPRSDVLLGGAPSNLVTDQYDTLAFGGTIGAGVELSRQLLPVPVFLEVRYNADATNSLSCCPRDMSNRAFDILLGIEL